MVLKARRDPRYWHCHVKLRGSKKPFFDGVVNDLTEDEIHQQIVEPWRAGQRFTVGGLIIEDQKEVSQIRIVGTAEPYTVYADQYEARGNTTVDRRSAPFWEGNCTDYTHEMLFKGAAPAAKKGARPSAKAFVVHGHDSSQRDAVALVLKQLEIEPIILMEKAHEGRTLIEKLERYGDVGYAVIICTADDVGRATTDDDGRATTGGRLNPRARQNVVLEYGYFMGLLGRKNVCVLRAKGLEMPSDLHGVGYHTIDSRGVWKTKLAKEMKAAGLPVDMNKM
jgi:predicted nucleotide-binding protein